MVQTSNGGISRRDMLRRSAAASLGLAGAAMGAGGGGETAAQDRRPNIVVIYTDDHNFEHTGSYGYNVHTPHMDSLGRDGVRFTRGHVTLAICTPSRYGCMTGRFPARCQHETFLADNPPGSQLFTTFNTPLEPDRPNMANVLQRAGYATGMVGKWHLGGGLAAGGAERYPRTSAYHRFDDEPDPSDPKFSGLLERTYEIHRRLIRECGFDYAESFYWTNPEGWGSRPLNIHNMEWMAQGAVDFIDQNRDRPFFLYMAPTLHHLPHPQESLLLADPRVTVGGYLDRAPDVMPPRESIFERIRKAGAPPESAFCTWLDDGVGAVLNRLREHGIEDNTLVFLVSDHQTLAKGTLYEDGVNCPFFVRWPDRIPAQGEDGRLVQNIDIAPTVLDAAGVTPPRDAEVDGTSLLPMLTGETPAAHDMLFYDIGWTRAAATERWKYLALRYTKEAKEEMDNGGGWLYHNRALQPHQHNVLLVKPGFFDQDQLYDLATDYKETTNLAYEPGYGVRLNDMKDRMAAWLETFGDHPFGEFNT